MKLIFEDDTSGIPERLVGWKNEQMTQNKAASPRTAAPVAEMRACYNSRLHGNIRL